MESTEIINCKDRWVKVIKIEKDGNCLFRALGHQLYEEKPHSVAMREIVRKLRIKVAEYIRCNKERYGEQIKFNYDGEQGNNLLTEMELLDKYCTEIQKEGVWGGAEVIDAISRIHQVQVRIYMEGEEGGEIDFNVEDDVQKRIRIAYRRDRRERIYNHYDSVIDVGNIERGNTRANVSGEEVGSETEGGKDNSMRVRVPQDSSQINLQLISKRQEMGYTVQIETQGFESLTKRIGSIDNIKIATWNVRGCTNEEKREKIDEALKDMNIDLAVLQETHIGNGNAETCNYLWWTAGVIKRKEYRGVAILISKNRLITLNNFKSFSGSVCSAKISWNNHKITLINVHLGSETERRSKNHREELSLALAHTKEREAIVIAGDLNAHIGTEDLERQEREWIGPQLGHKYTNENGRFMKGLMQQYKLTLNSSWSSSKLVQVTWERGGQKSQLDHILANLDKKAINHVKAKWINMVETDHKILHGVIMGGEIKQQMTCKREEKSEAQFRWNTEALEDIDKREKYQVEIEIALQEDDIRSEHPMTVGGKWELIKQTMKRAAKAVLRIPRSPMTPRRRKAKAEILKRKYLKSKFPDEEKRKWDLKEANRRMKMVMKEHFISKCGKFVESSEEITPAARLKELYKLIKYFRRESKTTNQKYIPMFKWERVLDEEKGEKLDQMQETDNIPLPPAPNMNQIVSWIKKGKKGRAPGIDGINLELLANAPTKLIKEITALIGEAWEKNEIPEDWNRTIQIPIPKIKNPKELNNYRRISLCSVLYKLYAKHILHCLEEIMPSIPSYQAAFMPGRNTDDHLFTAGRILEERWRSGQKTFILALDLVNAFPSIYHEAMAIILKHNKVPHKLINRIITACINEVTMIQWFGKRSPMTQKGKGLKQGCPLSPRLFNIAINEVLQTMTEVLGYPDLEQEGGLSLPMVLVFADDVLILADSEGVLQNIVNELTPLLESIGLKINNEKSNILIRDPLALVQPSCDIQINGKRLDIVKNFKYLGIQITNRLNRKININDRIKKAYMVAHSIYPFFSKYRLPWNLIKRMYNTYIIPVVTYGLKTMVLTKRNRNQLREMERNIIRLLASTSIPHVKKYKVKSLMGRKTIMRKIIALRVRYWGHIVRKSEGHMLQRIYKYRSKGKKTGRPCFTWITCLQEDKLKWEIKEEEWKDILQNKGKTVEVSKQIFQMKDSDSE